MLIFQAYFKECGGLARHNFEIESGPCCAFIASVDTWQSPGYARDAAESVYAQMNAGHRKNGRVERSLSVGDLLLTTTPDGTCWFVVDRYGMRSISEPPGRLVDHPHVRGECSTGECSICLCGAPADETGRCSVPDCVASPSPA